MQSYRVLVRHSGTRTHRGRQINSTGMNTEMHENVIPKFRPLIHIDMLPEIPLVCQSIKQYNQSVSRKPPTQQ
jgi:hypothetical protein